MKLNRSAAELKRISKKDDSFADCTPSERVGIIWDITAELWSLNGEQDVKRRLQRNVTNIIKKSS